MTGPPTTFEIHESQENDFLRLSLTGELDRWSAPILEDRLARFRAMKLPVRLDLSRLEFVDSTGIRVLIQSVGDARIKGWQFGIEREVAPKVLSVFRIVHLDHFIGSGQPAPLARPVALASD